jgi:lysozyme|tara:strand:+ start:97 stop:840 length:744 start_codon:yes stop_codon:yes gene_type:complete
MSFLANTVCRLLPAALASFVPALVSSQSAQASVAALPTLQVSRSGLITSPEQSQASALPYIITPERRALLNTIRFAEGTWKNGHDVGYRVMFGGSLMGSMDRHPDRVIYSSRYASAAAGAYQFMPFTWDLVKRSLGVRGFGPEVQDQGALFLVQRRKALRLTDVGVMTPQLAAKLAPEWASFPTLRGRSYYGQPVKRFTNLQSFYKVNLSQLRQIRDQRQEALSGDDSSKGPKAPVCTGPKILCGMP